MNKAEMLDVMHKLESQIQAMTNVEAFAYVSQRNMIKSVFNNPAPYSRSTLMLRLTVIDALYSTNAAYSYFSIEDIATAILNIGTEDDAKDYFKKIARGEEDDKDLFANSYGIRKNTQTGGVLISLISKYAYYVLLCDADDALGFPIYDSLALEMFPKICKHLGVKATLESKNDIEAYVTCLNALRAELFGQDTTVRFGSMQQFDILDAFLWRLGKIEHGSYSLLFTKTDYPKFFENVFGIVSGQSNMNEAIYNKFHKNYSKLCKSEKTKSGNYNYTIEINKLIVKLTRQMSTSDILKGINDSQGAMAALIDTWKKL